MKDKANKGYWQRLAKIYAPLMESDKKFLRTKISKMEKIKAL